MFIFAAVSGLIAIVLGAWSAHGAEAMLGAQPAEWIKTGVQYQAWHTLALLAVGIMMKVRPGRFLEWSGTAFAVGIVCFSGSLYLLAISGLKAVAYVTPLGGMAFIAGWLLLSIYALVLDRHAP